MSFDETEWWGDCSNTFHEEQKQLVYAVRMGLVPIWNQAHPPSFDLKDVSVIDLGGGPVSLLLKCINHHNSVVVDPAEYPPWVRQRYLSCGIDYWQEEAEVIADVHFGEAWIYNMLQHVRDPETVVKAALANAEIVRIFEWIDFDPYPGHPHRLEAEQLDEWFGAKGFTVNLKEQGAVGRAYYGVFAMRP